MAPRVAVTLVTGATPADREAAVAALLTTTADPYTSSSASSSFIAVLLEGIPAGHGVLADSSDAVLIQRIAPGCLCCTGNLVLRVTLNRLLRRRPERLLIGVATTEHLDQLRSWLQHPPYDQLLELTPDDNS